MMDVRLLRPLVDEVDAVVAVPGSKSIANRALVCAALADGSSALVNVPDGDDTVAMIEGLRALGAGIEVADGRVVVTGLPDPGAIGPATVHAALAGTTSRFLTAFAALGRSPVTVDGSPSLQRRQFGPLHDALVQLGAEVTPGGDWGHLPVTVRGPLTSSEVSVAGDVSSQFITALMLIAPALPDGLHLKLTSRLVSRPYVEMTASVMGAFGAGDVDVTARGVRVGAGRYVACDLAIEPDASSASYPLAIAAVRGGKVTVPGLGARSLQGDARFADLLRAMGCDVQRAGDRTVVERHLGRELVGVDVDMSEISDLVPTLAAVALFASTPTRISGVGFIRGKESDRLGDLARELRLVGGDVDETDDGLLIRPSGERLDGGEVATHHDHRLAMAFAVIGSVVPGIAVADPDVVTKSWPAFWDALEGLAR
jgi:3-phosphoshikimate 1-carboxyvinyltransferase